jgi:hypothetical protein
MLCLLAQLSVPFGTHLTGTKNARIDRIIFDTLHMPSCAAIRLNCEAVFLDERRTAMRETPHLTRTLQGSIYGRMRFAKPILMAVVAVAQSMHLTARP